MSELWYFTCRDNFLSGWGQARGLINILILEADSMAECLTLARNALDRSDCSNIQFFRGACPEFDPNLFKVSYHTKSEYRTWYSKSRPFLKSAEDKAEEALRDEQLDLAIEAVRGLLEG